MTVSVHQGRGAKEPHNKELYCVAWSTDMHIGYEYDYFYQHDIDEEVEPEYCDAPTESAQYTDAHTGQSSRLSDTITSASPSASNSDQVDEYKYESDDGDDSDESDDESGGNERRHRRGTRRSLRLVGVSCNEKEGVQRRVLRSSAAKQEPKKSSMFPIAKKQTLDRGTRGNKGGTKRNHSRKSSERTRIDFTIDEDDCIVIADSDDSDVNDGDGSGNSESDDEDESMRSDSDDGDKSMRSQSESSDSSCQIIDVERPKTNGADVPKAQREPPELSKSMPPSAHSSSTTCLQDRNTRMNEQNPPTYQRLVTQRQKGDLFHWYTMATCGGRYLTIYQVQSHKAAQGTNVSDTSSINGNGKRSNGSRIGYTNSTQSTEQDNVSGGGSVNAKASAGSRSISPPYNGESDMDMNTSVASSNGLVNGFTSDFQVRQVYRDVDEGEVHFTAVFVGRSRYKLHHGNNDNDPSGIRIDIKSSPIPNENGDVPGPESQSFLSGDIDGPELDTPQLCCVGGKRGIIKVIDTVQQSLIFTLTGHTNDLYDMKACPSNEWLLLSASNDETIRLWNLKVPTCIAIFAGHHGHREAVLSIDWHPLGQDFVSSGMDGTIKIWSCQENEVRQAIENSFSTTTQSVAGSNSDSYSMLSNFPTVVCQLPIYSTAKLHTDYIDCVKFCGDLILSKSTTNVISLWKPVLSGSAEGNGGSSNSVGDVGGRDSGNFIHLQDYNTTACDQWYVRFGTDVEGKMLAIGNGHGHIRLWEIGGAKKPHAVYNPNCTSMVRMVSFSPDGRVMVAVTDVSYVWKFHVRSDLT